MESERLCSPVVGVGRLVTVVRFVVCDVVPGIVAVDTGMVVADASFVVDADPGPVVIVLPFDFGVCPVRRLVAALVAAKGVVDGAPEIVTCSQIRLYSIAGGEEGVLRVELSQVPLDTRVRIS